MTLFNRLLLSLLIIAAFSNPASVRAAGPAAAQTEIRNNLRNILEAEAVNRSDFCRGAVLCTASIMLQFYESRDYQPNWSRNGRLNPKSAELVAALAAAEVDGLRPEDYHLYTIRYLLAKSDRLQKEDKALAPAELADLDLLLTDAFLLYGSHLLNGRINPQKIHTEWTPDAHPADLVGSLSAAISSQAVTTIFQGLRPPVDGYRRTMEALARLRDIAKRGGWPALADGPLLRAGMSNRRIPSLRQRLVISGDYEQPGMTDENLFDDKLAAAVQRFQRRHGLRMDGIVGPETRAALNIPAARRLRQLEINLERWRWIPHDPGQCYIIVNIADFSLQVMENKRQVLTARVVVGKPQRNTPVLNNRVEYLVLNPYWYLPKTIIVEDIAPNILANPDYLAQRMIKVFARGSDETQELDPATIDWAWIGKDNLPYILRQEPGPLNALGQVKILFPNQFSIYLHDTPSRELFQKSARDFSSGCIRVEKPIELVAYLLKNNPRWSREKILASMASGTQQVINLPEPIPIYIFYWTAWVDEEGVINFRKDIYNQDEQLAATLDGLEPRS
jgi:murein L,D-transpeptidase YcbB/YkuD